MGQLESVAFGDEDGTETTVLNGDRSIQGIANAIKEGRVKKICVLTGAGISCAAGIPDFRSPKTGIYHNLQEYNLPNPEAMFEVEFFKNHPTVFYSFLKVEGRPVCLRSRNYCQENTNQLIRTIFSNFCR